MEKPIERDLMKEIWQRLQVEAESITNSKPLLTPFVRQNLLEHTSLSEVLAHGVAVKLASSEIDFEVLRQVSHTVLSNASSVRHAALRDPLAVHARDPACHSVIQAILLFKGFQALQCHRVSHHLWQSGQHNMAYFFQMRVS